jgi:hypothetical protein
VDRDEAEALALIDLLRTPPVGVAWGHRTRGGAGRSRGHRPHDRRRLIRWSVRHERAGSHRRPGPDCPIEFGGLALVTSAQTAMHTSSEADTRCPAESKPKT